jgi:tetratricopeptide (TPR) repeat protein
VLPASGNARLPFITKSNRHPAAASSRPLLGAALLAALFAVKLVVALQFDAHPLLQPDTGLDTTAYVALAKRAAAGDLALGPGLYYVSPLYIYFLAAVYAVAHSFTAARVVQVTLGTAAVALIFVTTRAWFGRRAAWLAAVFAALCGVFTYYEALLLQSSLDTFLTALALWLLTRALQRDDRRDALLAGIAFGVAALNRPNMLLAIAGVAACALVTRRRSLAALLVAGAIAGVAPVTIRNLVVAHQWSLVSSHGGINFLIGNGEGATGYFHAVPGMRSTVDGLANDAHRVAERETGRRLSDAEVSSYFTRRALAWMRAHPAAWLRVMAMKMYAMLNTAHVSTPFSYTFYAYDTRTPLRVLLLGPWLIVPLGVFAMLRARTPLAWFALAYAASVVLFFVTERYKLPLFVALTIAAGAGADWLLTTRWRMRDVASVALLFVVCNWPLHLDDGRGEERTRMAEHYAGRGDVAAAEEWTRLALERGTDPASVHLRVASQLLNAGAPAAAVPHLEQAVALLPGDARAHYLLGRALLGSGRAREAVGQLQRALALRVDVPLAPYDLAVALQESGDNAQAAAVLRDATPPATAPAEVWMEFGKRAAAVGAPDAAERFLRRAVQLAPQSPQPHALLGTDLLELRRYADAAAELAEAQRLHPGNADVLAMLAFAEAELGRDREAWQHARKALELRPKHPIASRALGQLIARGVTAASMR